MTATRFPDFTSAQVVAADIVGRQLAGSVGTLYPHATCVQHGNEWTVEYFPGGPAYPALEPAWLAYLEARP